MSEEKIQTIIVDKKDKKLLKRQLALLVACGEGINAQTCDIASKDSDSEVIIEDSNLPPLSVKELPLNLFTKYKDLKGDKNKKFYQIFENKKRKKKR